MSLKTKTLDSEIQTSKTTNIILWVLQIGVAAMLLMAGFGKLSGSADMVGLFNAIGIGQWFRYVTGLLEVVGGILLFIPAFAGIGGLLLVGVMAGAIVTHLFIVGGSPAVAILLFVVSLIIAYGRRGRTLKLINHT